MFSKSIKNGYLFDQKTQKCVFYGENVDANYIPGMSIRNLCDLAGKFAIEAARVDSQIELYDVQTGENLTIVQAENIDVKRVSASLFA